jgi:hypothetical protein
MCSALIDEIAYWARRGEGRLRGRGRRIIEGLTFDNDDNNESWEEACRRYTSELDAARLRAKEKAKCEREAATKKIRHCTFCSEAQSPERRMCGNEWAFICDQCIREATTVLVIRLC